MKRKRFIKLLMGRLMLTRNEATYVANAASAAPTATPPVPTAASTT